MKKYRRSIFIFRRDLRIHDNLGFLEAIKQSTETIACFIFDPRQISSENSFASMNAIQFMIQSIKELQNTLKNKKGKLYLFYGKHEEIIEKLLDSIPIDAVFMNKDYTPFSIKRDQKIEKICSKNNIDFLSFHDVVLNYPQSVQTLAGTPYSVFTPYFKKAKKISPQKPQRPPHSIKLFTKNISTAEPKAIFSKILTKINKNIFRIGGREEAKAILKSLDKFKNYEQTRDFPAKDTTGLSAHIKFGTISIREVYDAIVKKLGKNHPLIRQLYWHDFFTQVAYFSPFVFGQPFHEKYKKLQWSTSKKNFEAWCKGKTGFPIIDAGMRQLNTIGFMHNRARMLTASFLTKDLHINWLWGEKYFAQNLVDYDPAVNNGNWQWAASTGCDAQPYFRIFNPWLQQKKFDADCLYIKKWIPELKNIEPKDIHNIHKKPLNLKNYPNPIVDHKKESARTKELYRKAARNL